MSLFSYTSKDPSKPERAEAAYIMFVHLGSVVLLAKASEGVIEREEEGCWQRLVSPSGSTRLKMLNCIRTAGA